MKLIHSSPWLFSTALLLLGTVAVPPVLGPAPAADEVKFSCVPERTLYKRFVQHTEVAIVELQFKVEGPDGPDDEEIELPDLKIQSDETIEFSDEVLEVADDRPKKLKRSFTKIENGQTYSGDDADPDSTEEKSESGLLDKSVVFTWNDEDDKFDVTWFEDGGDDALLTEMVEDADFRAWLPQESVDTGDSWKIPVAEVNNLQEPSGPMGYRTEGEEEEQDEDPTNRHLRENVQGELKGTYKGTREEEGLMLAVIAFEGKFTSRSDRDIEEEEGLAMNRSFELAVELEGELLWDIAGGHFASLTCDSKTKQTSTDKASLEIDGETLKYVQVQGLEGVKTYRFTCSTKKP